MPPYCGCSFFKHATLSWYRHTSVHQCLLLSSFLSFFLPLHFSELCMLFLSLILTQRLFCWQLVILRNCRERIRPFWTTDSLLIWEWNHKCVCRFKGVYSALWLWKLAQIMLSYLLIIVLSDIYFWNLIWKQNTPSGAQAL